MGRTISTLPYCDSAVYAHGLSVVNGEVKVQTTAQYVKALRDQTVTVIYLPVRVCPC
jgi:hypothetical protein